MDGIDFVSFGQLTEHAAFFCKETGELHMYSEDMNETLPAYFDDPERYIALPHKRDLGLGKPLVLKFAREHLADLVGTVEGIFKRRGAYSSYKDILEREKKLQEWYEYERRACETAVREWCESVGIEVDG